MRVRAGGYFGLIVCLAACGGGQARAPGPNRPVQVRRPAAESSAARTTVPEASATPAPAGAAPAPEGAPAPNGQPRSSVRIRGVHGTLNLDDIHQTMEGRGPALDDCIQQGRRRIRWVNGTIRFAFKVDAEGRAADVRAIESDLGHRELELCLVTVVTQTQFPLPAGRTLTRDFHWDLSVDPAYRAPEPMDPALLDKVLAKKAKDVYKECKLPRARNRFQVTAYVNPKGRITSLGAVHTKGKAADELDCVLEQVLAWRLPRVKKRSKVSFLLK